MTRDRIERDAWDAWKAHQADCSKCRNANLAHDRDLCEKGRAMLHLWRVAIHVAEHGKTFPSDTPEAIAAYAALGGDPPTMVGLAEYRHAAGACYDPSNVPALRGRPCGDPRCAEARALWIEQECNRTQLSPDMVAPNDPADVLARAVAILDGAGPRGCDAADDGPTCERCLRPLHRDAGTWRDDQGHAYCETQPGKIAPHETAADRETAEGLHAVADMPGENRYGECGDPGCPCDLRDDGPPDLVDVLRRAIADGTLPTGNRRNR